MDIPQTVAPAAVKPQNAERSEKVKETQEGDGKSPFFSQLLQGLQTDGATAEAGVDTALSSVVAAADEPPVLDVAVDFALGGLSVESLVGQTQHLDAANVDAALQDGSLLLQRQASGLSMNGQMLASQGGVLAGQQVAVVAAGVQPLAQNISDSAGAVHSAAVAVMAESTGVAEAVAQTLVDSITSGSESEGRIALHGQWSFEEPQMAAHPALQRLAGQVEQWAAAAAGLQPKNQERTESGKQTALGAEWLSAGQGSGTRLTEQAVQETQQTQDAAFESQAEAPVEDMRFWLQGRQQRAEVVMDKDGQPVRVQVALRGNEAHVTFHADQAQTREMLDASVAQLRDMLQQQGLELAGVSVQAQMQGEAQQQAASQRTPWEQAPPRQAQVVVPVNEGLSRQAPQQGMSWYA
ncbi:MAG TPA: flagellar hook-length control protein FliK [Comamonas sp.]